MKKIFTLLFGFCCVIAVQAQMSHVITASGTSFTPNNLTILAGDTVVANFVGTHSITEVSETDWNNNTANSNGGFWIGFNAPTQNDWFVLTEVGTYYYMCIPHASMGMKGIIEVINPTVGIEDSNPAQSYFIAPNGNGSFTLNFSESDEFVVFSITGQQQHMLSLRGLNSQAEVDFSELTPGIYLGIFMSEGERMHTIKFAR